AFALPAALAYVVDRVIPGKSLSALALVLAGIPALIGGYTLTAWVRGRAVASLSRQVTRDLLDRIFRHVLRLPLPVFNGRTVVDLGLRVQGSDRFLGA